MFHPRRNLNVQLSKGVAIDGRIGFLVRLSLPLLAIPEIDVKTFVFRSNTFRICFIWDGGVQNYCLLFGKNQAKWAAVAHRYFITREYHLFLHVSFCMMPPKTPKRG
jgi:hypothetical protein